MPLSRVNPLLLGAITIALVLMVPLLTVTGQSLVGSLEVWRHLWQTVLGEYTVNSLLLAVGVAVLVTLIGVPTAWLTARCDFPGRRPLSLLLLLPMAMPAYIIAYTYTGVLDFAGPVQQWIRSLTGLGYGQYWFFEIRSLGGAVAMLSLVLYPYVYLMSRAAFLSLSDRMIDTSRSLGVSSLGEMRRVILPLTRPAIVVGVALALMETLADYGTVEYFGVPTFTTGIFRTYYGFGDGSAAAQLSLMLLGFVLVLLTLESHSRRRIKYFAKGEPQSQVRRNRIPGYQGWLASLVCLLPPLLGFLLPGALLLRWSLISDQAATAQFLELAWNSFSLAAMASLLSLALALVLAYALRAQHRRLTRLSVRLASVGYALPGTIVAIGVLSALTWLDHTLVAEVETTLASLGWSLDLGLLFSGSLAALLFAYSVRFMAVSIGAVHSGLQTIQPSLDHSARLLGNSPGQVLWKIHLPLLRRSALTALLIVFVDVLKELPATLMLRPFNFNTLAVRAFELASDERLIDAAPASLMIVAVGIIPVILLNRSITEAH
ncbi:ABC transporter permease [Ferrimonas futtsuensis]|uniref:ABC transporter permease n=1 Tax=Ferrimonas futtsuensis TaxID=364764 RepID=UPI00040FEBE8|nr:iron ABC transporter permease [Ferrimonas futtsuensis]